MILSGEKTWEIRGRYTHRRGKIALIRSGSGLVLGTCDLVAVKGPLTLEELQANAHKAGLNVSQLETAPYVSIYVWVVEHAVKFAQPCPYKHPKGAVTWVKLRLS
jgi:hypothetical protein